jgi:phage terminase Nu1 subunit (DNA packaging protein)
MSLVKIKPTEVPECRRGNIADVAAWFGVVNTTVRAWIAKGRPYLVRGERGQPWVFDLLAVALWRYDIDREASDTNDPESLSPKERLDWYRGARERLALERDRGEVIPADEVETAWVTLVATAKGRLMAVGPRVAQELADIGEAREIERRLKAIHKEILRELAGGSPGA